MRLIQKARKTSPIERQTQRRILLADLTVIVHHAPAEIDIPVEPLADGRVAVCVRSLANHGVIRLAAQRPEALALGNVFFEGATGRLVEAVLLQGLAVLVDATEVVVVAGHTEGHAVNHGVDEDDGLDGRDGRGIASVLVVDVVCEAGDILSCKGLACDVEVVVRILGEDVAEEGDEEFGKVLSCFGEVVGAALEAVSDG